MGYMMDIYGLIIGLTLAGIVFKLIAIAMFAFCIIGMVTTIKYFINRKKTKETPGQKWLRTGRMD